MRREHLVCLVLALGATTTPAWADEWSKVYPLSGRPALRLETGDGNIHLVASEINEIRVHVDAKGWEIGKDAQITEDRQGDHVSLSVRVPRVGWNLFSGIHRSIRIDIQVPHQADLDLHTGDGNVNVHEVSGRIRVQTGDGNITSDGLTGQIWLQTGDGRIEGYRLEGGLDARTSDGNVDVSGCFDSLQLKSGDGDITATAESRSRPDQEWSLRSGDGTIRLRLPRDFSADLDVHTGDGRIHLDYPVTVIGVQSKSTIRGRIGTGGGMIVLHTGDGSIYLERQ